MSSRLLKLMSMIVLLAGPVLAQQPKLQNAKLETISAGPGLRQTLEPLIQKQPGPLWIGYSIPVARKERTMCCFDSYDEFRASGRCCNGCRLGKEGGNFISGNVNSDCGPLEPPTTAFVMLRAEAQKITKVRTFTPDCPLDAAGLPVYWLEQVNPAQSIDFLTQTADSAINEVIDRKKDMARQALHAIALHNVPEADAALKRFIAPSQPERMREGAALFLGIERGKAGFEILKSIVRQDQNESFRKKALLGFAESDQPEAIPELIYMARNDSSTQVRSQALFWLAQKGGKKEAEQITDAIQNDPETEVKKKAVFALSQMPKDEGVPLLISVAKTNKNPVVRKEAIRWLGFSNDPRALDFIEQILTK
jgi:HEAT repeats